MTLFETLTFDLTTGIASIALARPASKNAMNYQMVLELIACFEQLKRIDPPVRVTVLSGINGTFCAGGDLKEMGAFSSVETERFSTHLDKLLSLINQSSSVVIAKVEGVAMGGGFGLVCVADIAVTTIDTRMGLPEVRLGLVPAVISPYVIERVGLTRARELMLTGRRFDGASALSYGVVHEAVPRHELDKRINAIIDEILQCSPHAIASCKELLFRVSGKPPELTAGYRANLLTTMRESHDAQEGIQAFIEKRAPSWANDRNR